MFLLFGHLNRILFGNLYVTNEPVEAYLAIFILSLLLLYSIFIRICHIHVKNSSDLHRCIVNIKNKPRGTNPNCMIYIPTTTTTTAPTSTSSQQQQQQQQSTDTD